VAKLNEIYDQLGRTTDGIGMLGQQSSTEIQKEIVKVKHQLEKFKEQRLRSEAKLKSIEAQPKGMIEKKIENLDVELLLKKEARALDNAIAEVNRAEKYCDTALNQAKVELVRAEIACLEAIKAKTELEEVIRQ